MSVNSVTPLTPLPLPADLEDATPERNAGEELPRLANRPLIGLVTQRATICCTSYPTYCLKKQETIIALLQGVDTATHVERTLAADGLNNELSALRGRHNIGLSVNLDVDPIEYDFEDGRRHMWTSQQQQPKTGPSALALTGTSTQIIKRWSSCEGGASGGSIL